MVDRHDIDALLIGALYGELTPADEARLAAHLESHPADRAALADLTHTRQAVRESRFLTFQLEPPQAVSALLIQEAARRAPKRVDQEKVGWFQRFAQSFLRHPAMAAAAMLVLVVSVAGTVYMRKGDTFTETAPPATHEQQLNKNSDVGGAQPATAQAPAPQPPAVTPAEQGQAAVNAGDDLKKAKPDSYRVDLATKNELEGKKLDDKPDPAATNLPVTANTKDTTKDTGERLRDQSKAPSDHVKQRPHGIEVRAHETPAPMDFESSGTKEQQASPPEPKAEPTGNTETTTFDGRFAAGSKAAAGSSPGGGGAANAVPATPNVDRTVTINGSVAPSANPAPTPTPQKVAPAPTHGTRPGAPPPAAHTPSRGQEKTAAPAAPVAPRLEDEKLPADKADKAGEKGKDDNLLQWAKDQHQRVIDSVRRNNCTAAASIAVTIYRNSPDYYRENVATDRSLKSCLAYINSEHDKEVERVRAAKMRALQQNDAQPAQTQRH